MKIEVPTLPPRHLKLNPSFSRLEQFTDCERRYLFDLLYPEPTSPAQAHGHRVHAQLERLVAGKPLPEGEDVLPQSLAGMQAWDELEAQAAATEVWVDRVRGLPFSGKIDVVAEDHAGDGFVVDWKTTKNMMNAKSQYEARRSLQLQIYCLALGVTRAVFVYLPHAGGYHLRDVDFSQEELEISYRRLKYLVGAVRSRWAQAGAEDDPAGGIVQPEELSIEPFSVAKADYTFCKPRWCSHWARCLGKEPENGQD